MAWQCIFVYKDNLNLMRNSPISYVCTLRSVVYMEDELHALISPIMI